MLLYGVMLCSSQSVYGITQPVYGTAPSLYMVQLSACIWYKLSVCVWHSS